MAGTIRHSRQLGYAVGGVYQTVPMLGVPVPPAVVSTPGSGSILSRRLVVAAEGLVSVWDYTQQQDFVLLELMADGYLHGWYKVDTPTSASDPTPSGSNVRWRQFDLTGGLPGFVLNTDAALIHGTVATDVGETNGLPSAAQGAAFDACLVGKVYAVAVKNPSETAPVQVQISVLD